MDYLEADRYDRGMWTLERLSIRSLRRRLLANAQGQVLEVGAGSGANLALYPAETAVTAIELRPAYVKAAAQKAATVRPKKQLEVAAADAQYLPFPGSTFDTVVGTLVFCSISDPELALSEVRRVLRPGGMLLLLEHVRGQGAISRRLTDWLHPFWYAVQGECHLNRETARTVSQSGFTLERVSTHARGILQMIQARKPDG